MTAIPCIVSHGPAMSAPGHRAYTGTPRRHTAEDRHHTAKALRARSLRDQRGPHWEAYAHCDRAPFGWEIDHA